VDGRASVARRPSPALPVLTAGLGSA